jgi:hypothetical protein
MLPLTKRVARLRAMIVSMIRTDTLESALLFEWSKRAMRFHTQLTCIENTIDKRRVAESCSADTEGYVDADCHSLVLAGVFAEASDPVRIPLRMDSVVSVTLLGL